MTLEVQPQANELELKMHLETITLQCNFYYNKTLYKLSIIITIAALALQSWV